MAFTKPRLFLTGGSGFLGHHLIQHAFNTFEVHYVVNNNYCTIQNAIPHKINLNNYHSTVQHISLLKPDFIVHLAAVADANYCQLFPWNSWKINVEATVNLAKIANEENIPFAFTSTDLVFDGTQGNYSEEDTPNPVNKYGLQKLEAENLIRKFNPNAAVFRLPLMFGKSYTQKQNYLTDLIAKLQRNEKVNLFTDEYRSICGANSVAQGILKLITKSAQGTFHLGGTETLSRYEFGILVAKTFCCNQALIHACKQEDFLMAAPRPKDVSLNSSKAIYLGFRPLSSKEELRLIANDDTLN
jgi:dTDP-4-dehydrorhamnose reductase